MSNFLTPASDHEVSAWGLLLIRMRMVWRLPDRSIRMASKPGADSFLASLARQASARVLLTLAAVAVLALAGCGGGGDSSSGQATSPSGSPSSRANPARPRTPRPHREMRDKALVRATQLSRRAPTLQPRPGSRSTPSMAPRCSCPRANPSPKPRQPNKLKPPSLISAWAALPWDPPAKPPPFPPPIPATAAIPHRHSIGRAYPPARPSSFSSR
jgi:hypothetical protein